MTNVVDAIARLSHVLDFIARAVGDAGVRHGVAVVTVRLQLRISRSPRRHLQENGSFALRADGSRATHRLAHGEDIVSVGLDSRDVVLSHLVVFGGGGRALRRGSHSVLVVLDHEHHRQVPQLRHVGRLPHLTLVAGAITEHCHADVHLVAGRWLVAITEHVVVVFREGETRANGSLCSHNAGAAEEVLLGLVHVHRSSLSVSGARGMTKKLVDHRLHTCLTRSHAEELHTVATVTCDPVIVGSDRLLDTRRTRFLFITKPKRNTPLHRKDGGIHESFA